MNLKLDSQLLMARDNFRPDPMGTISDILDLDVSTVRPHSLNEYKLHVLNTC